MTVPKEQLITIIVPLYGEAANIPPLLQAIDEQLSGVAIDYRMLLVDDGSLDNTWQVMQEVIGGRDDVQGIRLSRNFGKEGALAAGLDRAEGDAIILMDADLQHPPELIPQMLKIWQAGEADIVNGVKAERGRESLVRRVGALLFYRSLRLAVDYDIERLSDFKLLDRQVVEAWQQIREYNTFFRGLVEWLGFRQVNIPFEIPPRADGESRWTISQLVLYSVNNLVSFTTKPLLIILVLSFLFLLGALALSIRVIQQFITGTAATGFTTVILLQLIIGGTILFSLSLIGLYIAKIYEEVKYRPRYVVSEEIGMQQASEK